MNATERKSWNCGVCGRLYKIKHHAEMCCSYEIEVESLCMKSALFSLFDDMNTELSGILKLKISSMVNDKKDEYFEILVRFSDVRFEDMDIATSIKSASLVDELSEEIGEAFYIAVAERSLKLTYDDKFEVTFDNEGETKVLGGSTTGS